MDKRGNLSVPLKQTIPEALLPTAGPAIVLFGQPDVRNLILGFEIGAAAIFERFCARFLALIFGT